MESYLTGFPKYASSKPTYPRKAHRYASTSPKMPNAVRFPTLLKDNAVSKAVELGGASWGVYGVGDGFNNNVSESAGNITVTFNGYNYDQLWAIAEQFKEKLLTNQRIKEVNISSERSWTKNDYSEYFFGLDNLELVRARMTPSNLLSSVTSMLGSANIASVQGESYMEQVRIESKQGRAYDVWNLNNTVQHMDSIRYKMASFATIEKGQAPQKRTQDRPAIQPDTSVRLYRFSPVGRKNTETIHRRIQGNNPRRIHHKKRPELLELERIRRAISRTGTYRRDNIFPVFHTFQFAQATGCSNNGDTDIPYRPIRHVLPFRHTRGPGMLRRNDTAQRYYGQRLHIHP